MLQNTTLFLTKFLKGIGLCLLFSCYGVSGQKSFKTGEIIDTVPVVNTTNESFALYLPSSYSSDTPNPIIFLFEPGGRGRIGILPFLEASEKYGLILVCSNSSKNGSFQESFSIAQNLFNHIFNTFSVDVSQMFVGGFSGGSRLATAIASLSGQFTGVVACGAGFSPNPAHRPSLSPFLYVGICGVKDMNYKELLENQKYLSRLKFKNTLISFDGGHQWPDKKEINRAIDWLFISSQRQLLNESLEKNITNAFIKEYELTQDFLKEGELLFGLENYQRILQLFPQQITLDSVRLQYNELTSTKRYKTALKNHEEAFKKEELLRKKLLGKIHNDLNSLGKTNFNWWKKELEKLDKMEAKGNKALKRMLARVRYSIIAAIYERRFSQPGVVYNDQYKTFVQNFREMLHFN